ncbi:hypothetical protein JRG66_13010 [Salinimicrobium tongyeongense]|jgi:hypothetical protein|uniref:Lipoprotein n=1 Tax=Salinimicrobium tongyeongense TaxID=2809707 RepID=A0ABY6NPQ9_9FLAO|nr:hypothetical protein [Salinimicrobium tongyeongense]UZH54874.1 hypothetical protein JRG66_13010 [Salinimicrobium tongyeongense]
MKKLTIAGILILFLGCIIYLFAVDDISGLSRALLIGLMIGSALALRSQIGKS